MDFIKTNQLDIMLFLSGVCGILVVLTLITGGLSRKRKRILSLLEAGAMLLLMAHSDPLPV